MHDTQKTEESKARRWYTLARETILDAERTAAAGVPITTTETEAIDELGRRIISYQRQIAGGLWCHQVAEIVEGMAPLALPPVVCTDHRHRKIKRHFVRFLTFAKFLGVQEVGEGEPPLLLATCRNCGSTLALVSRGLLAPGGGAA